MDKKNNKNKSIYVRGQTQGEFTEFAMGNIDDWSRLIFLLSSEHLHSIKFRVYDVDNKSIWDRIKDFLARVLGADLRNIPVLSAASGTIADDLNKLIIKDISGRIHLLFESWMRLDGAVGYMLQGNGKYEYQDSSRNKKTGKYEIRFSVKQFR